jgi:hypothetical protein
MLGRNRTLHIVSGAFFSALTLAALTFALCGAGAEGTDQALRVTARFSFLLFWLTYAGGLIRRFPVPFLARLGGLRREFGLGFASAHSVHVLLILWRYRIGFPASTNVLVVDGIGIIWMYVLVVFSLDHLRRMLAPLVLRIVFNGGLEYIAYVFLADFLIAALARGRATSLAYLPFTVLLLGAAAARWSMGAGWIVKQVFDRSLPQSGVRMDGLRPPTVRS